MSELIDREALLDECLNHYEVGNIEQNCTMDWICKTVRNFPAAQRWVRCEEEPKEDGDYLTYYIDGFCAVNHWSKGWGWMYDEEAVRYWMPIEPPKEDA